MLILRIYKNERQQAGTGGSKRPLVRYRIQTVLEVTADSQTIINSAIICESAAHIL